MISFRRPPMPFWDSAAGTCWWCGGHRAAPSTAFGHSEYPAPGWWHEDCLRDYGIAVSSKAQRYFLDKRDYGMCVDCGANAERAMWRAMRDDPAPPFYGYEIYRTSKRRRDNELACSANATFFRRLDAPRVEFPEFVPWQADHDVPLWSVDRSLPWVELRWFWSLENLVTRCEPCHVAKTAAEAAQRAALRRVDDRQGVLV